MENIVRKGEIACNKQFLLFLQCFLPYMVLIFYFECTLKCRLRFVSIWTSLQFCRLVMNGLKEKSCDKRSRQSISFLNQIMENADVAFVKGANERN